MIIRLNIKQKIICAILVIGLMSEVIGLSIIYFIGRDSLKRSIGETFQELARLTSDRLELLIEHHIEEAFSLASSNKVRFMVESSNKFYENADREDVKRTIEQIEKGWHKVGHKDAIYKRIVSNNASLYLRNYGRRYNYRMNSGIHHNIIVTDKNGVVVSAAKKPLHYYYGDSAWWKKAYSEGKGGIYFSDIKYDEDFRKYIFSIAEPIRKGDKTIGVFLMMHNADKFFGWVTSVKVGSSDHTMLASDDGILLFCPIFPTGTHKLNDALKAKIFKEVPGWTVTKNDVHYGGEETINAYAPVPITSISIDSDDAENFGGKRWYIFTSQDPTETYASMYRLLRWIVTTGFMGIIIWLLLGWIVANNIVKPIRQLQTGVKIIGDGNLDYSISSISSDEIGALAGEFNKMAKKLKSYYRELEELNLLKSDFVSKVSHELRTPLTSIKGFVEILLTYKDIDEKTNSEFLTIINEESTRLTRLINDLLDLSRIESGKVDWKLTPLNLYEIINFTVKSMMIMATAKKITLTIEAEDGLPRVMGNKDLLIQVFDNLINNAVKFTEKGEIVVGAKRSGKMIKFFVSDTGIGIPDEDMEKIFDKFHQMGNVYTDRPKGTGLGLSISKEIITNFGGEIWCESKEGVGTTFYFTVPSVYA